MSSSKKSGSFAIKKAQYYVWYLGWKECRGLGGREFTEPIVKELIHRRTNEELPKLTIEVSKKDLKIVQLVENRKGKIDKVKYPPVLSKDVTYAVQALSPDEDVVACIFLGYNPHTKCAVHVHVYRCDSVETASLMVRHLNQLANLPEHSERARRIEEELANKGQVVPRPGLHPMEDDVDLVEEMPRSPRVSQSPRNPALSNSPKSPRVPQSPQDRLDISQNGMFAGHGRGDQMNGMYGNPGMYRQNSDPRADEEAQSALFDSLADELKHKLGGKPLLLPAKDYDTINRVRGNRFDAEQRKCLNANIVGRVAVKGKIQLSSTGTDDSAKGDSDSGSQKNSQDGDVDLQSTGLSDPSPRSLKSSGRFSAGFGDYDNGLDDVDAELAGMPSPPPSALAAPQRPFSPGPNTQDLKKSYFSGDKTLPGYLPNTRPAVQEDPYSRGYSTTDRNVKRHSGPPRYNEGQGGGGAQRYGRQRSQDEGYTSLERRDYPQGYFEQEPYSPRNNGGPYSPRDMDFAAARQGVARKGSKLRRQQPDLVEPPIDYTIAVRHNEREVPRSSTVFR